MQLVFCHKLNGPRAIMAVHGLIIKCPPISLRHNGDGDGALLETPTLPAFFLPANNSQDYILVVMFAGGGGRSNFLAELI